MQTNVWRPFALMSLKPCPHQQQSNSTSRPILSTRSNVASTLLPFFATMLPFWQQFRTKFRPFHKVETNWICSICYDFVERKKFYNKIVLHCCQFWQQSRMLLRQSRTLFRHCCWCGRSISLDRGNSVLLTAGSLRRSNNHKSLVRFTSFSSSFIKITFRKLSVWF